MCHNALFNALESFHSKMSNSKALLERPRREREGEASPPRQNFAGTRGNQTNSQESIIVSSNYPFNRFSSSKLKAPPSQSARGPETRWTEDTEGTKRDSTRFFKALERCKADRCWERFGGVGWRTALCALARVSRNRGHLAARMTMHHHRRTGYFRTFPHFYPFTYFPRTYVRVRLLYTGTRDIRLWTLRMSPRAATHPATCR